MELNLPLSRGAGSAGSSSDHHGSSAPSPLELAALWTPRPTASPGEEGEQLQHNIQSTYILLWPIHINPKLSMIIDLRSVFALCH